MSTKLVYSVSDGFLEIDEIQGAAKSGLIPRIINKDTRDISYVVNQNIIDSLLKKVQEKSVVEFDKQLKKYTAYNNLVPQIYGEGTTEREAIVNMIQEAKSFANDYRENSELFSNVLDGTQQFYINNILLNIEDDTKIREILKIS